MTGKHIEVPVAAVSGALFGIGLMLSGMATPDNVLGFLNLSPNWNPMLIWVMGCALSVTVPGFWLLRRRGRPFYASSLAMPASNVVDRRLIWGAILFGAGWGLAGYCPGPAVVGIAAGEAAPLLFFSAMIVGAAISDRIVSARVDQP